MTPRILAALAAAFLGLVPVGALAQTISGGGGSSVPLTASCLTQSVSQLCFDATNTLAQRNGVNAQTFNIYNTYTDASNYEDAKIGWGALNANQFGIAMGSAGTGLNNRSMALAAQTVDFYTGSTSGQTVRWRVDAAGNLLGFTAGTYVQPKPTTVSGLASCASGADGARSFVTDASATTFASSVTGGGSNHVPVYCDGGASAWKIG